MSSNLSYRIGQRGIDELSSVERARLELARHSRLESHILAPASSVAPLAAAPEQSSRNERRDPRDLHDGIELCYLPDSAFNELFKDITR